jgi:hypothetical protein
MPASCLPFAGDQAPSRFTPTSGRRSAGESAFIGELRELRANCVLAVIEGLGVSVSA